MSQVEIRNVPADWQHPVNERGHWEPLYGHSLAAAFAEYAQGIAMWALGFYCLSNGVWKGHATALYISPVDTYQDWVGTDWPNPDHYMPDWPEEYRTHFQLYELTSEGTPISPVFSSPAECYDWHDAQPFGSTNYRPETSK